MRWTIRNKVIVCLALLMTIIGTLAFSGFQGVYSYRRLARSISKRAEELPLAEDLRTHTDNLQAVLKSYKADATADQQATVDQLFEHMNLLSKSIDAYENELHNTEDSDLSINDTQRELEIVHEIRTELATVDKMLREPNALGSQPAFNTIYGSMAILTQKSDLVPRILQQRMGSFVDEVRMEYRTWIVVTWVTTITATALLVQLIRLAHAWILKPFNKLISGSRRVAQGDLEFQIQTDTDDDMAELADAMNNMTRNFRLIRNDLDEQVQIRTKEAIRSEQLASVGFLAAGVSHEINNPLASIAMCAESLESRITELANSASVETDSTNLQVIHKYLQRIQHEAFRCKGITERLLDFSRVGETQRQRIPIQPIIEDTLELIKHIGKYKDKSVEFEDTRAGIFAIVHPQEIKQVMLNLLTNALDSLDDSGLETVKLAGADSQCRITITDDGCGMTSEVLQQLFQPFFTRRRDG
ncbi:MAG: ATP-binding protein, partial [Planctomycetota bacterium]|nr:ATP-binding protein [Planctomycetota bacterium]